VPGAPNRRHVPAAIRRVVLRGQRTGIRLLVLGGAVLLVLGVGASFGYRALRDSSLFAVHDVAVTGANASLSAQVQASVRESVGGRGLLALSPGKIARAVELVPGVHVARVDRDFPSTLRVRVWPEHAVAIAKSGHDRVVVSATGRVLARIDNRAKPPSLPRIPLPGHGVPRVGTRIENPRVLSQLSVVSAIPVGFGARVGWTRLDPEHGLELQLNWPKLWIRLGPPVDLAQKLRAAALVLRAYPTSSARANLSYVDVSAPARPAVMPLTPDSTTEGLAQTSSSATSDGTTVSTGTSSATGSPDGTSDATTASASANP
jgi:cell division septal protein FtsQ